ncbi:MAG: iron-sulfur cluster assembly accessory protein [Pseudomonadota bacterium]|nr:iron-sulfur cluster assembly accessory protein [Pseudomonadota bacterium]
MPSASPSSSAPGGKAIMTMTDAAAQRIRTLMETADPGTVGLRIGVRARGCSGMTYTMTFDSRVQPADEVIREKGVTVIVDAAAVMFLAGSQMDYTDDGLQSSFVFRNPNEKGRCGCGESFQV